VVTLKPGPLLGGSTSSLQQEGRYLSGQGSGLTSSEDQAQPAIQVLRRLGTDDRDMPAAVELEAVGRQIAFGFLSRS
jgi:hypothetical protein